MSCRQLVFVFVASNEQFKEVLMSSKISKRLKMARSLKGYSQAQLAKLASVPQQTIARIENSFAGSSKSTFKLAWALGVSAAWLAGEVGHDNIIIDSESELHKNSINTTISRITVRGTVQAGLWAEALEWPEDDQYQVPFDHNIFNEYPIDRIFSLQVAGDSMDREYKEGTYLYCTPIELVKRKLNSLRDEKGEISKDHVIVERQRNDGRYECTVKEIEYRHDGSVWLWPKSNNPDHQAALSISDPHIANRSDNTIIRVTALVIGSMTKRP